MKALKVSLIIILMVALTSCVTFTQNAYKSLAVSKQTYEAAMTTAGDFYKQGLITDKQKVEVIKLGGIYKLTHNESVNALLTYVQLKTSDTKDLYVQTFVDLSARLASLLNYLKPLILEEVE